MSAPSLAGLSRRGPAAPSAKRSAVAVRGHGSDHPLVTLPPELKALISGALAKGTTPTKDMCTSVVNFCRSVGAPCDDNIYKAAMGAFGLNPVSGTTPADALPGGKSGFKTWQSLFVALCDAYRTNQDAVPGRLWQSLRTYVQITLGGRGLQIAVAERSRASDFLSGMKQLMRAEDTPRRLLDRFLTVLYEWLSANATVPWAYRSRGIEYDMNEWLDNWTQGKAGPNNPFATETSAAMAMFLVLWMRGARLNSEESYVNTVDKPMYQAILDGLKGQRAWENVYAQARRSVQVGCNANHLPQDGDAPDQSLFQSIDLDDAGGWATSLRGGDITPTLFELALLSRRTDLILLLLKDGGAKLHMGGHERSAFGVQVMSVLSKGALEGGTEDQLKEALHRMGTQILLNVQSEFPHFEWTERVDAVEAFVKQLREKEFISPSDKIVIEAFGRLLRALQLIEPSSFNESDYEWTNGFDRPPTPNYESEFDFDD